MQTVLHNKKLTFGEWVRGRTEVLFSPNREPNYSLEAICHFFAKRLSTTPNETMTMDEDKRNAIFDIEKEILDEEIKQSKQK